MVEQFGLEIILSFRVKIPPLISGTMSGIFFFILQAEELSMTVVPSLVNLLAHFLDISPPAEKIAMLGLSLMASCIPITSNVELLKITSLPILLLEATGISLVMGNFNSDNTFRISEPTSPVQPTIAIFII